MVPAPRECITVKVIPTGCFFAVAENEKDKEDEFAANDLNQVVGAEPGCLPMNGRIPMVGLERPANTAYAKELLHTTI